MRITRCTHRRHASVMLVCTLGLSLGACHQGPPAATPTVSDADRSTNHVPQKASDTTAHSATFRSAPPPTQRFASMVQALPTKEQTRVRDWYQRIGGPSMDGATAAQIAWMQARHYPMPADIARAESMNEAELKAAADTGDTTAQILYVVRLLDEYSEHASANTPTSETIRRRARTEVNRMMPQVLASGSPYAGYLYAAKSRLMYPGKLELNAPAQLAGLVWASKFGDTRAGRLMRSPAVQAVNGATAAAAITVMLGIAILDNPRLFSARVSPIPGPDR